MDKGSRITYYGLDILRIICAVLVVTIHFAPFGPYETTEMLNFRFVQYFSKNAVPLFFIISSFLLFNKVITDGHINMKAVLKRCWGYYKLYLIWTVIYLFMIVKSYTHGRKSITELIRDFFFVGSYLHLWYLPALITGVLIVALLVKAGLKKRTILIIAGLLYVIALLGQSYYGLLTPLRNASAGFDDVQALYFRIFYTTRNGVFEAPLFVSLGYMLSGETGTASGKKIRDFIPALAAFFALEIAEAELVRAFGLAREADFYITTPFLCCVIFQIFVRINAGEGPAAEKRYGFLRELAAYIYFVQMYAGMVVKDLLDKVNPAGSGMHYLFLPVLAGSFLLACLIIACQKKLVNRHSGVV